MEVDRISTSARACLFNSFNFHVDRLRAAQRPACRMVHRVDGPVGTYRGTDDDMDRRIAALNGELADATVFQSLYSLEAHRALGIEMVAPTVIVNAVDPRIFHPPAQRPRLERKVRIVASSWSDNPNKGAATYQWLDRHLDRSRFELTFVGRVAATFEWISVVPPVGSMEFAEILRSSHIYVAPSLNDPCSNALLEALACGLPAVYANSGGHPELVGDAGSAFDAPEEIPALLDRLVAEYDERRARIAIRSLSEVADAYLRVLGLEG